MSPMNAAHACGLTARRAPSGFFESRTRQLVPAWATSTQSLPPVLRLDLRHGLVSVVSCVVCHCCSFASVRIIAADSAGSRAWVTRWVQARVNRSTSSAASTYTSPISPST